MLIVSEKYNKLESIVKNEASGRKTAIDLISGFIAELTRIKNEFDDSLSKEAAVLGKTIGSLIRSWSDICAVAYSEAVVKITKSGYKYALDPKSNSANFRDWLNSLNYNDEGSARSAIFAMAQACTDKDSRYTSTKKFKDLYRRNGIVVEFSIPMTIEFMNGYTAKHKTFIERQIKSAKSPFHYEHYIPVNQIRNKIYNIVESSPDDMQEQISKTLTCMLVCWITGYENSRIPNESKIFREQPFEVYSKAKIQLYKYRDGSVKFGDEDELKKYISDQLELDNKQ